MGDGNRIKETHQGTRSFSSSNTTQMNESNAFQGFYFFISSKVYRSKRILFSLWYGSVIWEQISIFLFTCFSSHSLITSYYFQSKNGKQCQKRRENERKIYTSRDESEDKIFFLEWALCQSGGYCVAIIWILLLVNEIKCLDNNFFLLEYEKISQQRKKFKAVT